MGNEIILRMLPGHNRIMMSVCVSAHARVCVCSHLAKLKPKHTKQNQQYPTFFAVNKSQFISTLKGKYKTIFCDCGWL